LEISLKLCQISTLRQGRPMRVVISLPLLLPSPSIQEILSGPGFHRGFLLGIVLFSSKLSS
jgi:hypothetical protein